MNLPFFIKNVLNRGRIFWREYEVLVIPFYLAGTFIW